jgi:hypothetical protein
MTPVSLPIGFCLLMLAPPYALFLRVCHAYLPCLLLSYAQYLAQSINMFFFRFTHIVVKYCTPQILVSGAHGFLPVYLGFFTVTIYMASARTVSTCTPASHADTSCGRLRDGVSLGGEPCDDQSTFRHPLVHFLTPCLRAGPLSTTGRTCTSVRRARGWGQDH